MWPSVDAHLAIVVVGVQLGPSCQVQGQNTGEVLSETVDPEACPALSAHLKPGGSLQGSASQSYKPCFLL
jgi:hypothetical protein